MGDRRIIGKSETKLSRPGLPKRRHSKLRAIFTETPAQKQQGFLLSILSTSLASPQTKNTLVQSRCSDVGGNICLPEG